MSNPNMRPTSRLTDKLSSRVDSQVKHFFGKGSLPRKIAKIGAAATAVGLAAAGYLGRGWFITEEKKKDVEQIVHQKEQTLSETAVDYAAKAQESMSRGDVNAAISLVKKAEGLEPGTQYADLTSRLNKASAIKDNYDNMVEKAQSQIGSKNYKGALETLRKMTYDMESDKDVYVMQSLAGKLEDLGVDVNNAHGKMIQEAKKGVAAQIAWKKDQARRKAEKARFDTLSSILKTREATMDGSIDAYTAMDAEYEPASELQGALFEVYTKQSKDMVPRTQADKTAYDVLIKLEHMIEDNIFSAAHTNKLLKTGELRSIKLEENQGRYNLILTPKEGKEITTPLPEQYTPRISGMLKSMYGDKR